MIVALFINFLFLSVICVGVDHVVVRITSGGQWKLSRTDAALVLCCAMPIVAYVVRGVAGLMDISPLAVIGPTYVYLTKTTIGAINLKQLMTQTWEGIKNTWKQISGVK